MKRLITIFLCLLTWMVIYRQTQYIFAQGWYHYSILQNQQTGEICIYSGQKEKGLIVGNVYTDEVTKNQILEEAQ